MNGKLSADTKAIVASNLTLALYSAKRKGEETLPNNPLVSTKKDPTVDDVFNTHKKFLEKLTYS